MLDGECLYYLFPFMEKVLKIPSPRNYPGTMVCFLVPQQIGMFYQGKTHIFSISEKVGKYSIHMNIPGGLPHPRAFCLGPASHYRRLRRSAVPQGRSNRSADRRCWGRTSHLPPGLSSTPGLGCWFHIWIQCRWPQNSANYGHGMSI